MSDFLVGLTVAQAAALAGKSYGATSRWLSDNGYRSRGGTIHRVQEIRAEEDQIRARVAQALPSEPCWRCGARSWCDHRQPDLAIVR